MAEFHPKTFAFLCNWCTYTGADLAGTSRMLYPADFRVIKVPCTGRIDMEFIIKAFEQGADGVWVSGCHIGDCHYNTGNYYAQRRWTIFRQELAFLGIDLRRLKFTWISAAEGRKFADEAAEFVNRITKLGPYNEFQSILPENRELESVSGGVS
jgi:coenzyme F420-reducing hydrogenase delta subunit